jgi:hypothetical protein
MNCRFLHHMEYKPKTFVGTHGQPLDGFIGNCRNKGCKFRRSAIEPYRQHRPLKENYLALFFPSPLISHQTAPGPSDRDKGSPYTTAGASPSTGAPAPLIRRVN